MYEVKSVFVHLGFERLKGRINSKSGVLFGGEGGDNVTRHVLIEMFDVVCLHLLTKEEASYYYYILIFNWIFDYY